MNKSTSEVKQVGTCPVNAAEVAEAEVLVVRPKLMRLAEVVVGHTANYVEVWAFDYVLYPFVLYMMGPLKGGIVMMGLSFVVCMITIWFYDWSKRDWLGIEAIKSMREYSGKSRFGRLTAWVMRKSEPAIFIYLSLMTDPFITMVAMRHGAYNGMSRRDWRNFLGSFLLGNLSWICILWTGISLAELIWHLVRG